jgi:phage shock protein C
MKRLYLSKDNKKIFGICGGIGEYFDIDPTLIRVIAIIAGVATMLIPAVVAYFIAWLIIPPKPEN